MSDLPLLSIVTATYNRAASLPDCLASVLAFQGVMPSIEHIIVDNMSMDGTKGIVEDYARKVAYPVIYVREPDSGIYDALNKGIINARGRYVHLLHSDDVYSKPETLTGFAKRLKDGSADVLACSIRYRKEDDREATIWEPSYRRRFRQCRFPHTGCIVKRSFYVEHGGYDTRLMIVSDSLYMANEFSEGSFEILPYVLVDMATSGVSSKDSLRLRLELLLLLIMSKNLPLYYKVKRTPVMILNIVRYLEKSRFSDMKGWDSFFHCRRKRG